MIAWLRHQADLQSPVSAREPKLGTKRAHYEKAAAKGHAKYVALLAGPEYPEAAGYLHRWATELHATRRWGEMGPEPLGWADVAEWARLTGRSPTPAESHALMAILAVMGEVPAKPADGEGEA